MYVGMDGAERIIKNASPEQSLPNPRELLPSYSRKIWTCTLKFSQHFVVLFDTKVKYIIYYL